MSGQWSFVKLSSKLKCDSETAEVVKWGEQKKNGNLRDIITHYVTPVWGDCFQFMSAAPSYFETFLKTSDIMPSEHMFLKAASSKKANFSYEL